LVGKWIETDRHTHTQIKAARQASPNTICLTKSASKIKLKRRLKAGNDTVRPVR
jgi:hypothetical protein